MYSLIFYSGDFSGLGPVVFIPLIGGFHVKNWCAILSCIFILYSLNFWIVVDYASLSSFKWEKFYFSRIYFE